MAYNDVSNRNSHEKKKHGGLFQTDPNPNPSGMDDPISGKYSGYQVAALIFERLIVHL